MTGGYGIVGGVWIARRGPLVCMDGRLGGYWGVEQEAAFGVGVHAVVSWHKILYRYFDHQFLQANTVLGDVDVF